MKLKSLFVLFIVYLTFSSNFINSALLRTQLHSNIRNKIDSQNEENILSFEKVKVSVKKGNDVHDLDANVNFTKNGFTITKIGTNGAPINEVFSMACNDVSESSIECDFKGKCESFSKLEGDNLVFQNKLTPSTEASNAQTGVLNVSISFTVSEVNSQINKTYSEVVPLKNGESINKKFDHFYSKLCEAKVKRVEETKRMFITKSSEYATSKAKLNKYNKDLKEMSDAVKEASKEVGNSNKIIVDTKTNSKNIEFQITNLNKLINGNNSTISSAQKQISQLSDESLKLKEILELAKTAIDKDKDNYNNNNKNQKSLQNQQIEIDHLKEEVIRRLAEIKKQMEEYEKSKQNIISSETLKVNEIDLTNSKIDSLNKEQNSIKGQKQIISKELENSQKSNSNIIKTEEDYKIEVSYINETIENLLQKKKDILAQITSLSEKEKAKEDEVKKEQQQMVIIEANLTEKEKQKQELIANSIKIKNELEELQKIESKYGKDQKSLELKYKEYQAKHDQYEQESKSNQIKIQDIQSVISSLKSEIKESETKIVGLKIDISTSFETTNRLNKNIKTLNDTNKRLASHQASFRTLLQDINKSLEVYEDQKTLLQYRINTYSSKLESISKSRNSLASEISKIRTTVNSCLNDFRKEAGASSRILVDMAERALYANPTTDSWRAIANRIGN